MNDEAKITIEMEMFNQEIIFVKGFNLEKVMQKSKEFCKLNNNIEFKKYGPTQENDVWYMKFYFLRGTAKLLKN
jgi:hypothetical protein